MSPTRPQLVPASRPVRTLEASKNASGTFDVDAFHAMERRDEALIADEILNGAGSSKFVYNFNIQGTEVAGISVVGARHLAAHYGGMKHRIIASVQKTGALFTFTSYPQEGMPMDVRCSVVPELENEEDFYGAVVEIVDVKSGNSIQIERRENRYERRRDKTQYERPNYATIAQSKAYRNAVLALIPQDVQIEWRGKMLKLGKGVDITDSVIDTKRSSVIQFAAAKAIPLQRQAVDELTMDQIAGLSEAAHTKDEAKFRASMDALGLTPHDPATGEVDGEHQRRLAAPDPGHTAQQGPDKKTDDPGAGGKAGTKKKTAAGKTGEEAHQQSGQQQGDQDTGRANGRGSEDPPAAGGKATSKELFE
jgi:hypothetical protein